MKKLKFKLKEQNVHFVSDLHWDHNRDFIWGAPGRAYKDVHEMNRDIIWQWNANVGANDIAFHLGDTIFGDKDGTKLIKLYDRLNFKVLYELWGNHTSGVKHVYRELLKEHGYSEDVDVYPLELELAPGKKVVFLGDYAEVMVDHQRFVLCHYPMESWNGIAKGNIHIFGHCHGNLPQNNTKRIDVGWDQKRRPLHANEIVDMLKNNKGFSGDHHK